ncbi:DUF6941 family protein, partial [Patescibacteria group bacterium]
PDRPHPQMCIITSVFVPSGGQFKQIIKLVKESDPFEADLISPIEFIIDTENESEQQEEIEIGFISQINNVKFSESGKYLFKVYVGDDLLKNVPINVIVKNNE